MKVVPPKEGVQKTTQVLLPLIEDPDQYALDKSNSVTWELRSSPTDVDSPKYKYLVRILQGNETPRQMIRWRLDVAKVCNGLNADTFATRKPLMEACMRPGVQAAFTSAVNAAKTERFRRELEAAARRDEAATVTARAANPAAPVVTAAVDAVTHNGEDHYASPDELETAMRLTVTAFLPRKILAKAKRALRRDMRKPADMRVRAYYHHLKRINSEELPHLPPGFATTQRLTDDELMDIILFGTPRSWQNEMERQGFDPMEKQLFEVIDFMENLESVEQFTPTPKKETKSSSNKKKESSSSSKRKPTHFCKEHGPNFTHNTEDCRVLAKKSEGSSGKKSSNKTWVRKSAEKTDFSKKEFAAFVKKSVKSAMKDLNSAEKKRKSSDDDSDEEGECHLVEAITGNLDGFNYEEMENLKIDDDDKKDSDEISV